MDDEFDFDNLPTRRSSAAAANSRGRGAAALDLDDDEACIDALVSSSRRSIHSNKQYAAVVLDDDDDDEQLEVDWDGAGAGTPKQKLGGCRRTSRPSTEPDQEEADGTTLDPSAWALEPSEDVQELEGGSAGGARRSIGAATSRMAELLVAIKDWCTLGDADDADDKRRLALLCLLLVGLVLLVVGGGAVLLLRISS